MEASSTIDEQSILGTPITWEIIEKDFQEAYETTAKTGDKREAKVIGGGMGYVSKLTHVFFDWTTDHDRLPKEAVVKITIPVQMGPVRFENGPFELDDRKIMDDELLFYSRVGNLKFLPPKLKVPQFFCGRRYGVDGVNAGYISMEHIDGSIHRHLYHNVCKNGIFEAIDQLVELAVFSLKYPESLTDWPKFGRTLLDHFLAICDLDKKALQMIEKFPDLKEEIEKYVANYDKVYRDYKRFMEIRRKTCTSQILCQGDVWTPNILWDLDEEGRFHVRALVDWQLVHVGSPLEDLVFLLHSACSVDDHENHLEKFLFYYYASLESRLDGGEAMPWQSFEEFKNKYETAYGYMCGLIWPMTWMIDLEKSCTPAELEECKANFNAKIRLMARESNRFIEKHILTKL